MKRIVVKVGTSTLTGGAAEPDRVYINGLAGQIAALRAAGRQVVLVTSGAIRAGLAPLGFANRPRTIPEKQAAAAVGQTRLMGLYADIFANHGIAVGQVLLTRDDLRNRARYVNARNTFESLLGLGALPIVNENDTVATDEIKVGDNDTLAALVTCLLDADGLILLSDVDGLFDKNPSLFDDARLIPTVDTIDARTLAMAGGAGSASGTGGMRTKLSAARIATGSGAALWIANGRQPDILVSCLERRAGSGTYFAPSTVRPSAKKRWIAFADEPRGTIIVNACARRALEEEGRSLLPVGIVGVGVGGFAVGDLVTVSDESGHLFARGVTRYGAAEITRIAGRKASEIGVALGLGPDARAPHDEVIHRDQLVLFA